MEGGGLGCSVRVRPDLRLKRTRSVALVLWRSLTPQRVHRDVLNWLKEWDQCVFKRTLPGKKRKLEAEEPNAYVSPLLVHLNPRITTRPV